MFEHNANSNPSASDSKPPDRPKLKILDFHGYQQNGAVFRAQDWLIQEGSSKVGAVDFHICPTQRRGEFTINSAKLTIVSITVIVSSNIIDIELSGFR